VSLHDFYCPRCGQVLVDIHVPVEIGATAGAPEHCGAKTSWIPATRAMDIGGAKTAGFRGFHTTDGRGQPVHIDSLHKMRQVERESEQAYRNGEGQPMVFRRWAQDGSNRDQPTLSKSYNPADAPTDEGKRKFGRQGSFSAPVDEPDAPFGPGVHEGNTSALPPEVS